MLQWPRLTALFHLDGNKSEDTNKREDEDPPKMRYEQPYPQDPDAYYKFYLHPDDIGQSVSQYSVRDPEATKGSDPPKTSPFRVCLGAMLLFSLAGVVCVAVTLAVLCEYTEKDYEDNALLFTNCYNYMACSFLEFEVCVWVDLRIFRRFNHIIYKF